MTARGLGNGITQSFGYYAWDEKAAVDNLLTGQGGRLELLQAGTSTDPAALQHLEYRYDAAGSVDWIKDWKAGSDAQTPQVQEFGYDELNRLTSASASGGADGLYSESYAYDPGTGNMATKAGLSFSYSPAHPHAVSGYHGNSYQYDANGNMTVRVIGADTYNLAYDAENRLVEVRKNDVVIATFAYDGDGRQVKSTIAGVTTTFAGAHYQVAGETVTKYYLVGGQRLAMRVGSTLYYLLADHLGSTSLTTDAAGNKVAELRYSAWGETRYTGGATPTSYRYTGQREEAAFGLYFYNARYYDPYLNHFTQADTIVPDPSNPQALDRYSYALNNPIRYRDPSGHKECEGMNCNSGIDAKTSITRDLERTYKIRTSGGWDRDELIILRDSLNNLAALAGGAENLNDIFRDAMSANGSSSDRLIFENRAGKAKPSGCNGGYACWQYWKDTIVLSDYIFTQGHQRDYSLNFLAGSYHTLKLAIQFTMIHEIGHVFADARPQSVTIYGGYVDNPRAFYPNYPGRRDWDEENMASGIALYAVTSGALNLGYQDQLNFVSATQHYWQSWP